MNLKISTISTDITPSTIMDAMGDLKYSLEELTALETELVKENISNEELRQLFKNISISFANTKQKLSKLLSISKDTYKTEYGEWLKKNSKIVAVVESKLFNDIKDIKVDYPTGMKNRYIDTVSLLVKFFDEFETSVKLDMVSDTIDKLLSSISRNDRAYEKQIKISNAILETASNPLFIIVSNIKKNFDSKNIGGAKKEFGKLFTSMDELVETKEILLKLSTTIGNIDTIEKNVTTIEDTLNICIKYVIDKVEGNDEYVPSKQFIKDFAHFIKQIDAMFVAYGDMAIITCAIHHNFTFVYSPLSSV